MQAEQASPPENEVADESDETTEIKELHQLFSGGAPSGRGSTIPVGLFVKYEVSLENRTKAEEARRAREMRDQERVDKAQAQYEETQARRTRIRGRSNYAVKEVLERNQMTGAEVRAHKQALEMARQRKEDELNAITKMRVDKARSNDGRLDALEDGYDEAERQEGQRARIARSLAAQTFRTNLAAEKKERAETTRENTQRAVSQRLHDVSSSKRKQAEETRLEVARGKALARREEQERLRKVAASRERAQAWHNSATKAKEEMLLKKQAMGQKHDRTAEIRVAQAKNALLRDNQLKRQQQFSHRYVGAGEAASYESSQFRNYYMMDGQADKQFAQANAELIQRIKSMSAITDNEINDDFAGEARAKAAAESKARKAAEAARIKQENAELQKRLMSIKAVIDDEISDDVAGEARSQAANASAARRKAERAALQRQNAEMQKRLASVKAITDDDVTDEATGGTQRAAACRSFACAALPTERARDAASVLSTMV